jgi:hypothetical protein
MGERATPNGRRGRAQQILLVGLTPLLMKTLEGPLSDAASVSAVPFPSDAFSKAAREVDPQLVVVDVTYLMEERVRPFMMNLFAHTGVVLAFISESGGGWTDDLGTGCSGPLDSFAPDLLLSLIASPKLTLVAT